MADYESSAFFGLKSVAVRAPDGACAIVTLHGGQVVSWIPARDQERLYLSPQSALDNRTPIRGGVPVVFPQFADYGPLMKHGFVRTAEWRVLSLHVGQHDARAILRVEDSPATHELWPHRFACELAVIVGGDRLEMELRVENPGPGAFDFCAALHTYIRVSDVGAVELEGLHGRRYKDRTRNDLEFTGEDEVLTVDREVDRVYVDGPEKLVLRDGARALSVAADGFPDVVVWNPWKDKCASLDDMPDDGYRHMICVEAAAVATRARVDAGRSWVGRQSLTLLR